MHGVCLNAWLLVIGDKRKIFHCSYELKALSRMHHPFGSCIMNFASQRLMRNKNKPTVENCEVKRFEYLQE